jgi:arylsulfatase
MVDNIGELIHLKDMPLPVKEYAAMVVRLDKSVGKLVAELRRLGIYDNTIIFFASDNGYTSNDEWLQNRGPFAGKKLSVEEGGCRVPFFVCWEGTIKPNVVSQPVWLPDFFPTAAHLAGAKFDHAIDGVNLWPLLGGNPADFKSHEYLYWNSDREQAVRMGAWKGYRKSPDEPLKLYLVEEDTYGERDLAAFYPDMVKRIEHIMDTSYTPHEWYWLPNETREDYQKKVKRARETGQMIEYNFPNGVNRGKVLNGTWKQE